MVLGRTTDRMMSDCEAPKLRAISWWRQSTECTPATVLTMIAKIASRRTTMTFDSSPMPATRTISGMSATFGRRVDRRQPACWPGSRGGGTSRSPGRAGRRRRSRSRSRSTHSFRLVPMCGQMAPELKSVTAAFQMSDGELISDFLNSLRSLATSHSDQEPDEAEHPEEEPLVGPPDHAGGGAGGGRARSCRRLRRSCAQAPPNCDAADVLQLAGDELPDLLLVRARTRASA